jgi:hypothetical protein
MLEPQHLVGVTDNLLIVSHPTSCVPSGRPCFDCIDATLERVTKIASMTSPTWRPITALEMRGLPSSASFCFVDGDCSMMVSSKKRYATPTTSIRTPPRILFNC